MREIKGWMMYIVGINSDEPDPTLIVGDTRDEVCNNFAGWVLRDAVILFYNDNDPNLTFDQYLADRKKRDEGFDNYSYVSDEEWEIVRNGTPKQKYDLIIEKEMYCRNDGDYIISPRPLFYHEGVITDRPR